ncbi:NAD(P)H-binding protein [Sphingomonas sp.]|uniref:NmrA family NAD(P)-binding protein n=1 Tax=Sphingomonas sp. TaxID=28214 RepID=UPI003B3B01B8
MIVVTTPTGDIGSQVVSRLIRARAPLRLIARDPARLAAEVRAHADIVTGSHGDPAVLRAALDGADTVFWLTPPDLKAVSVEAAYVDFTRPAAAAFAARGVRRVVSITALGRGSPLAAHAGHVTGSLQMDDLIAATGVAFRPLALPSFMDNLVRQAAAIRDQGKFFLPIRDDLRLPSVATCDIAATAVRWLLDESWTGREEVPVLGPEDLSFDDMARTLSDVLGRSVEYQRIGFDAYKARFLQFGMSDAMAQGMTDMARAKDQGIDLSVARTPANSTPTRFRTWCETTLKPAILGPSR